MLLLLLLLIVVVTAAVILIVVILNMNDKTVMIVQNYISAQGRVKETF